MRDRLPTSAPVGRITPKRRTKMEAGTKVKVIDKRDGAVILRGILKTVTGDSAIVAGRYEKAAFGQGEGQEAEETEINVPRSCVLKDDPEFFDVIVYGLEDRKVASIVGERMKRDEGFYNAEKRADTAWSRIDPERATVEIVPTGTYKIGDIVPLGEHG